MKIARLDGSTILAVGDHTALFPNTRFYGKKPDEHWLTKNSCAEVVVFLSYDPATQKNEGVTPYMSGGKVYTRRVTDMTSDEQAAVVAATNAATAERDKRLASCDWVVTKALESGGSVPSAWVTYRTALRDITAHANWPNLTGPDIDGIGGDWPTEPS